MNKFRYIIAVGLSSLTCITVSAQRPTLYKSNIQTLQTIAEQRWTDLPVIMLNSGETVNIDFDDLTHESQRYAYRIEHCDANWKPTSSLFDSDYIDGFADGNLIDNLEQSLNTNTLYTHYHFSIPNERCRLKLSGNYCVTVYDENDNNEPIFKTYFMVAEAAAGIEMRTTSNTDADVNGRHQQIEMGVHFNDLRINDWKREITTVFLQNNRWDNAVTNPSPQYIKTDGLTWTHCPQLVFDGGNEYRKFEILDVNHANMGVENLEWDNTEYHAYLWPDEPRPNYVYDEDSNGAYFIRNSDNREINYTSEYQTVHFTLKTKRLPGEIYLNGNWTHDQLTPYYQMQWNEDNGCYETAIRLKQGYYNYQYLWVSPTGPIGFVPTEGNSYQTENKYTALVYYHAQGSRYDRLVGVAHIHTR